MVEKIETPFHRFVALAHFDREVQQKTRELKAVEKLLIEKREQLEQEGVMLVNARAQLHQLKKDKTAGEHELIGLEQELERKKLRLEKTSEAREYTALMHEIEILTSQYQAKETALLDLWQQLEDFEPKVAQLEKSQGPVIAEKQEKINLIESQIKMLQNELDLLKERRQDKLIGIVPEWLNLYETMRRHVEDPAALMEKKLCSGCGSIVPPADQIAVHHHQLVVCQQCRRLLYSEN